MSEESRMEDIKSIDVSSLVGLMTGEALVQIKLGSQMAQLSCVEARDLALNILQCAEAAQVDLFLVQFAISTIGVEMQQAAGLLNEFREWRKAQEKNEES